MSLTKQRKQLLFLSLNIIKYRVTFGDNEGDPAKPKPTDKLQSLEQINSASRLLACLEEIIYG